MKSYKALLLVITIFRVNQYVRGNLHKIVAEIEELKNKYQTKKIGNNG
jgi:hypothetical protein